MKSIPQKITSGVLAACLLTIGGFAMAEETAPPQPSPEMCQTMYDTLQKAIDAGVYDVSMAIMKQIAERGC